eukprot:TRINITY_DN66825_c0_g1_i1.p1 TRINITY_DN66825_c0_g1~~TRINITY_DN66825_c0_g1_i1.p1  ORF type:complete len:466 (+),score=54.29 TRINITY_DN66825_c0_g1_i1:85-1398(+)
MADAVVMTVLGPVAPADLSRDGSSFLLCREWLLNDQSALVDGQPDATDSLQTGDRISLATVGAARRWPLCSLHNLSISYDDALLELNALPQGSVVVDSTPRAFWSPASTGQRAALLWSLAQSTGIRLIMGTAPDVQRGLTSFDAGVIEAATKQLVRDLSEGYELQSLPGQDIRLPQGAPQRVLPGVIGELALSSHEESEAFELCVLRIAVEAQRLTGAPVLLSGPISAKAMAILDGTSSERGPCLWDKCVFFDVPSDSAISQTDLMERGSFVGYCSPPAGSDIAWQSFPHRRPCRTEDAFLTAVTSTLSQSNRVLVGSGLRFRTDLQAFGGCGLAHTIELLRGAVQRKSFPLDAAGVQQASLDLDNAGLQFFQYAWQPPAQPEAARAPPGPDTIVCQWCGTIRSDGKHFSKMGFDYCSPKCIREHKQVDFAPDKRGV